MVLGKTLSEPPQFSVDMATLLHGPAQETCLPLEDVFGKWLLMKGNVNGQLVVSLYLKVVLFTSPPNQEKAPDSQ